MDIFEYKMPIIDLAKLELLDDRHMENILEVSLEMKQKIIGAYIKAKYPSISEIFWSNNGTVSLFFNTAEDMVGFKLKIG